MHIYKDIKIEKDDGKWLVEWIEVNEHGEVGNIKGFDNKVEALHFQHKLKASN